MARKSTETATARIPANLTGAYADGIDGPGQINDAFYGGQLSYACKLQRFISATTERAVFDNDRDLTIGASRSVLTDETGLLKGRFS